jgi:FMN phosphatase YigB (HAD superfamily)
MAECSIAVFDLGGVLIDWNPRYLYRKLFDGDTEAMDQFSPSCVRNPGTNSRTLVARLPMPAPH